MVDEKKPEATLSSYSGRITMFANYVLDVNRTIILQKLEEDLKAAFFNREPKLAARARERYRSALIAIHNAFDALGFARAARHDILQLAEALSDLDNGTVRHFLAPAARDGKPIDPSDLVSARAWVSIAIDMMISEGFTRKSAAFWFAENFSYLAPILSPGGKEWGAHTIENWHRAFVAGRIKQEAPQNMFNDRVGLMHRIAKSYPEAEADQIVSILAMGAIDEAITCAVRCDPRPLATLLKQKYDRTRWSAPPKPSRPPTGVYRDR